MHVSTIHTLSSFGCEGSVSTKPSTPPHVCVCTVLDCEGEILDTEGKARFNNQVNLPLRRPQRCMAEVVCRRQQALRRGKRENEERCDVHAYGDVSRFVPL